MSDMKKNSLIAELVGTYGTTVNRNQLMTTAAKYGMNPGFLTTNKVGRGVYDISEFASKSNVAAAAVVEKTDEELLDSMRRRFRTLDRMANGVVSGSVRSMIVSGPAGIGKTYTIEGILEAAQADDKIRYLKVSGFIKATGLYKILWENRDENCVILLDDADSAFQDEVALNILKAALDSNKRRTISWRSEKIFTDETGDEIPNSFDYSGSVIFITNLNFETMINQGRTLAPHFSALISRSFYIDLNLDSQHEYVLRIEDVLMNTDMAYTLGLDETQAKFLLSYIKTNFSKMREISLRAVQKAAKILSFSDSNSDFVDIASSTLLRRK